MIQPTGTFTLGNYLGALKNFVALQEDYDCVYALADLHAITVRQEPAAFRKNTLEAYAMLLAMGIDLEKSIFFIQSQVPEHAQLAWVLNCYTQFGELSRMTQFKDKSQKARRQHQRRPVYLPLPHGCRYPVVPSGLRAHRRRPEAAPGADPEHRRAVQRPVQPHLYCAGPHHPQAWRPDHVLQDPAKKMSKSDENVNSFITVLDDPDTILRKFKRAVTDSEALVRFDPENKPGVSNLMQIYSVATGKSYEAIEQEFAGQGYGSFKAAVGESVVELLRPIREETERLLADKAYLESVYRAGAEKAAYVANRTLSKVYKKVGFLAR